MNGLDEQSLGVAETTSGGLIAPVARLPEEWQPALLRQGERPFRAVQVFRWIHRHGVFDGRRMSNLPQTLRKQLTDEGLDAPAIVIDVHRSSDDTRKLVLRLRDGCSVECVLMKMTREQRAAGSMGAPEREAEPDRTTLCVSTQVGCAMGCRFCASGRAGLVRGLRPEEIVGQVLLSRAYLGPGERLRGLVFMGMGEPLQCYDSTARVLRLLTHPEGVSMSPRRITVSTVGLVPGIRRLGEDFHGAIGLALSLHSADDETRSRLVPMNARYPVAQIVGALKKYPLPRRRRITIEVTLVDGINDAPDQARALARLLRSVPVKVNLIAMNPVPGCPLRAPPAQSISRYREILLEEGYSCFLRARRGDDVAAACGQLALASQECRDVSPAEDSS